MASAFRSTVPTFYAAWDAGATVAGSARIDYRDAVSVAVAAAPGAERANRFIVILLGLQRLSYLLPALLTLGGAYHLGGLNTALVLLTVAGNVAMFVAVVRAGWFAEWMAWADVGWATMLTIVVSANSGVRSEER